MPTVEGGICAAVLLVRLAHPNLGGFTAVSGWAINATNMSKTLEKVEGTYHMFCKGRGDGSLTEITTLDRIYKLQDDYTLTVNAFDEQFDPFFWMQWRIHF